MASSHNSNALSYRHCLPAFAPLPLWLPGIAALSKYLQKTVVDDRGENATPSGLVGASNMFDKP